MSRRQQERLAVYAALGTAIGEALPDLRGLTLRHDVTHHLEYAAPPRPARVYAEVSNNNGEIWRLPAFELWPDCPGIHLNPFPIAWLTGRPEDVADWGQAGIELRFEWPR